MSALMSDVIEGQVTPNIANAGTRAGAQLLRLVELQCKYGRPNAQGDKELLLCDAEPVSTPVDSSAAKLGAIEQMRRQLDAEEAEIRSKQGPSTKG